MKYFLVAMTLLFALSSFANESGTKEYNRAADNLTITPPHRLAALANNDGMKRVTRKRHFCHAIPACLKDLTGNRLAPTLSYSQPAKYGYTILHPLNRTQRNRG